MVPERLEREVLIEAPLEVVWSVITEPEHINGWFGDVAEIELHPGGRLRLRWEDQDHTVWGRVERVEPPHFLSFRWNCGGAPEVGADNSTLVEFSLTAQGEATRLAVVESGFPALTSLPEDERERDAEGHRKGWVQELDELVEYAEGL